MDNNQKFYDADMERLLSGADYGQRPAWDKSGDPPRSGGRITDETVPYHTDKRSHNQKKEQKPERSGAAGDGFDSWSPEAAPQSSGKVGRQRQDWSFDSFAGGSGSNHNGEPSLHGENEVNAFGGWFFQTRDNAGHPVIRVVAEQMSDFEVRQADEWYGMLGRMPRSRFLHRTGSSPFRVHGHMVFDFEINNQMHSLGEMHRQKTMTDKNPEFILKKLNELIMDYRMELRKFDQSYRALNCLTMDTVFMDMDNNLMVLPVFYKGRNYPVEIAREAMIQGQKTDERSDLYAAAYVAVEAYSDSDGDKPLCRPESEVIRDCLQTIRDWRPTPEEVCDRLKGRHRPSHTNRRENRVAEKPEKPKRKPEKFNLGKWVKSFRGLEEAEDPSDTGETIGTNESNRKTRRNIVDDNDSWYEHNRGD